jgi:hypothetical protein
MNRLYLNCNWSKVENIQQPTSNIQCSGRRTRGISNRGCGFSSLAKSVSLGRLDAREEYANQFIGFAQDQSQIRVALRPHFPLDKPCPAARLPQFLKSNFELMDEIFARFSILGLSMVGIRRGSRSQKLTCHMTTGAAARQFLGKVHHGARKHEQTLFQIKLALIAFLIMQNKTPRFRFTGSWIFRHSILRFHFVGLNDVSWDLNLRSFIGCWLLDVRCWMFSFLLPLQLFRELPQKLFPLFLKPFVRHGQTGRKPCQLRKRNRIRRQRHHG